MSIAYFKRRKLSLEEKTIRLNLENQLNLSEQINELSFAELDQSFPLPVYLEKEKKDIFHETVSNNF